MTKMRGTSENDGPVMYVGSMDVYLNLWFPDYEAAREARARDGGFLFPYRHHFFVAKDGAVRELGLDPCDPDWERIGWDWARPADREAWERLRLKREIAACERAVRSRAQGDSEGHTADATSRVPISSKGTPGDRSGKRP